MSFRSDTQPTFRLGATSYVIEADLASNARYLAEHDLQDMELVLFDLDDGRSNLPSPETVAELNALAHTHDLTYTVHLPLDINGAPDHLSMIKARQVIEHTRDLEPQAYVLHLDGREVRSGTSEAQLQQWLTQTLRALERLAAWVGGCDRLAVENLEGYALNFIQPVIEQLPVSRCVDVGHLWLDGHDPLPYVQQALPRTRVIHLHGAHLHGNDQRDHTSLRHVPPEQIDPIIQLLLRENYTGVVTLEIFGETDFHSSRQALAAALKRVNERALL
jgi:sugar phosphate isomerase/epimerase